ncbi:MAG: LolA family protein [Coprobacillaceae bacterium]
MKKIYIVIGLAVAVLVGIFGFFKLKSNSLDSTKDKAKEYDKYVMTCHMEMLENDELKSYLVNVSYLEKDDKQFYKVELYDKSLNQSQVILKNEEGVFVLTPTLNQVFKFQSDWPDNSPKPYIYNSLLDMLDTGDVEKTNDGYIVKGDITYPNDNRVTSQEIEFTKALVPLRVIVYDKDETEIIKVEISEFDSEASLETANFDQQKVLEESTSQYTNVASSLPLYPVALMGSSLESETVSTIDDTENHILKFTGEKNFTIIESVVSTSDIVSEEFINGEVIELVDGIAFYKDNELTMIQSGIVCKVYSSDLSKDEMVNVVSSMQSASIK